jgi:hypothetical protein
MSRRREEAYAAYQRNDRKPQISFPSAKTTWPSVAPRKVLELLFDLFQRRNPRCHRVATKASVRAIEFDVEARGDASILSRCMGRLTVSKDASSFKEAPRLGCRGNWVAGFIALSLT